MMVQLSTTLPSFSQLNWPLFEPDSQA